MSGRIGSSGAASVEADARFAELYERHHRSIHDYCRRRLEIHAVDDAVSETFLTAWRRLDDVPDGHEALLWLYRVAYRVVGHQWRGSARRNRLETKVRSLARRPVADIGDAVANRDDHQLVLQAAETLGATDAEVLRLVAWEELSIGAIADVLEIEPNAVKQRIHRAKRNLARAYRRLDAAHLPTPDAPRGGAG